MQAKEVLELIEALSNEKHLSMDAVFESVEYALGEATRRYYSDRRKLTRDMRVYIDRKTGEYSTYRVWQVVPDDIAREDENKQSEEEELMAVQAGYRSHSYAHSHVHVDLDAEPEFYDPELHILLSEAQKKDANLKVTEFYRESAENLVMDRIAVQQARQAIFKKVRNAERAQILSRYSDQVGQLFNGVIERTTREGYIVLLKDRVESLLPHSGLIGEERFRPGETVRGILKTINTEAHGMRPQLILSRSDDKMLIELFKIEVPEVSENIIEILSVAREPGSRSKIAVKTNDGRIDPVGVCVGMRGTRVSAVTNQLNGERVDIILWDDNPTKLVSNALSPAKIESVLLDHERKILEVVVAQENLAPAVGTRGENVRLASKLIGWQIKIISIEDAENRRVEIRAEIAGSLSERLGITEEVSQSLVRNGLESLDTIFGASTDVLTKISGIDEKLAKHINEQAGQLLMIEALNSDEQQEPDLDAKLLALEGMNPKLAGTLNANGIKTVEDLAEQSVDEILAISDINQETAETLIMEARKPWLEKTN